jgi:hypothetical protein
MFTLRLTVCKVSGRQIRRFILHDICSFLKSVVERGNNSGSGGLYIVRDGVIYARTMGLAAGIAWPSKKDFAIPAQVLDDLLARMKEVKSIKVTPEQVIITGGRITSEIKRWTDEPPPLPTFKEKWIKSPPGLVDAMKKAQPFVGDRNWQRGMILQTGVISASNGKALIEVAFKPLKLPRQYILLPKVADFLIAQGDPDEMHLVEHAISFRWEDGRWMHGQRLDDEMPEGIMSKIFERSGTDAPIEIDASWIEALEDAQAMTDNKILLSSKGFTALKEASTTNVKFDVAVPKEHLSCWMAKDLMSVFKVANAWNPDNSTVAFFKGDDVRGAIAVMER